MSVHVWEFSGSINETDFQESVLGASEFCKSTYPDFLESIQDGEETGCIPEFLKSTKAGEDVGELPQKQVRSGGRAKSRRNRDCSQKQYGLQYRKDAHPEFFESIKGTGSTTGFCGNSAFSK